jgi:hypothetical protein
MWPFANGRPSNALNLFEQESIELIDHSMASQIGDKRAQSRYQVPALGDGASGNFNRGFKMRKHYLGSQKAWSGLIEDRV